MTTTGLHWSGVLRVIFLSGAAFFLGLLLSGLWRIELVSPVGRGWLLAYIAAAIISPGAALLILAAALPIVGMVTLFAGISLSPASSAEVLVLCFLLGATIRAVVRRLHLHEPAQLASFATAAIALTSGAAFVPVLVARADAAVMFTPLALTTLARDYLLRAGDLRPIVDAALVVESAALFAVARRACADAAFRVSLLRMLVAGAAAAAAFNIVRLLTVSARTETFATTLAYGLRSLRINVHHGDPNAAGSFFALYVCVALGFTRGRQGSWAWPAAAIIAAGLWLAGSRTAMAAVAASALLCSIGIGVGAREAGRRRLALGIAAVTVAVVVSAIALWPRAGANFPLGPALAYRLELWGAGVRMVAEHPIVGVGIGQFPKFSSVYRAPGEGGVPQYPENAHNNVLQIAAELGLPGVVAFLLWIAFGIAPAARRLRAEQADRLDVGLLTGTVAFALTWLTGHPLLLPMVAFPFWLALAAAGPDAATRLPQRRTLYLLAAGAFFLAASIPFRAVGALGHADLEHVGTNMSSWIDGPDGVKYRRAANCSGVYVPSNAASVIVPIRGSDDGVLPLHVAFSVDGRTVNAFVLEHAGWVPLRFRLPEPASGARYRHLSLRVRGGGDDRCENVRVDLAKVTALDNAGARIQ